MKVGALSGLSPQRVLIVSEHKADSTYPIVSAASILAKVERDRIISSYHEIYGEFGSGYPTDSKTVNFVKELVRNNQELPPIIRKSWKSVRKIMDAESKKQMRLG